MQEVQAEIVQTMQSMKLAQSISQVIVLPDEV
jgi:hypothetical protein